MDAVVENGFKSLDFTTLERQLLSSSAKSRINTLAHISSRVERDEFSADELKGLLSLLYETYPLYIDRDSREAVHRCLRICCVNGKAVDGLASLIKVLQEEVKKTTLAPGNTLALTEWLWVLLEQIAANVELWAKWGSVLILADARAVEACLASTGKQSIKHSALVVTRRALRKVFKLRGDTAVRMVVAALTAKQSSPLPEHAILLGIVAGVCARQEEVKPVFASMKQECFGFYTREILGTRKALPAHLSEGLYDLFRFFVNEADLGKEIIPSVEKALLRAPEIVLNGIVAPMLRALDPSIDLSDILLEKLLKPLISSLKSTNPVIRAGASKAFAAAAERCTKESSVQQIAAEVLAPLKQNKIAGADQKVAHFQLLQALPPSLSTSARIVTEVSPLAVKEANENALEAAIEVIGLHLACSLSHGEAAGPSVIDAISKGLVDKRPAARKSWALAIGRMIWSLPEDKLEQDVSLDFVSTVIGKMIETFVEVQSNALTNASNGLTAVACVMTALLLAKLANVKSDQLQALEKKVALPRSLLTAEPKPSFLLNPRVYSKWQDPEELTWAIRALSSLAGSLVHQTEQPDIEYAWSQAFLYFVTAANVPPLVRREAAQTLSRIYCRYPERIGTIIVMGIWRWRQNVELDERESAALAAKTGCENLHQALQVTCPTPEEIKASGNAVEQSLIDGHFLKILVLARPELIPRASWIDLCLRAAVDPGALVQNKEGEFLNEIITKTEYTGVDASSIHAAAYRAAADLAFVAPERLLPALVQQISVDLDKSQLIGVDALEAAIYRTPKGTAYVDVLASSQPLVVDKNVKDFDTLQWERELRAELDKKSGQKRKLKPDEQKKVDAQLAKESTIRERLTGVVARLRRGVGIVQALATGPPTEEERWIVQAVQLLIDAIDSGAGLLLGDVAVEAYLDCASSVTSRLGVMRPIIGIATLRALGVSQLPGEYTAEPLSAQITRVLYRLRFLGEQRPFDTISLAYILPLIFVLLDRGGVADAGSEEADEQLLLALEFLNLHSEACASPRLPRQKVLNALISSLQRYNQHYKVVKECLQDFIHHLEPTRSKDETAIILGGVIVPQAAVRTALLQVIDTEMDLSEMTYSEIIWLGCHDVVMENAELGRTIWAESEMSDIEESIKTMIHYVPSTDRQLRRAAAAALADSLTSFPHLFTQALDQLFIVYSEAAKARQPERDKYGMIIKADLIDPWETRSGVALAFKALAGVFEPDSLADFVRFLIEKGPFADRNAIVRDEMIDAAITVVAQTGADRVEDLIQLLESVLENPDRGSETFDKVNEASVIMYGALGRHLKAGDQRSGKVVQRLLSTLSTPSESVQYAVAECLPPLIQTSLDQVPDYVQQMLSELLESKNYAARRGAAYGLAGIVAGRGIGALREYRIMSSLKGASENKKDANQRQGGFLAFELLSSILGRVFEPYVIQIVPQLLAGFGDVNGDVREACLDASKASFATLSSYAVKQILPELLEGLDDQQWRSKKGACDSLGAMAYLDPQQLAVSLPEIIPPLTNVLNDSHKEVRLSAKRSLQRFGEVISNPEIKGVVDILLKALSDPTKYTDDALDALIKIQFLHFLDAPSLALVVRILERGLSDRSATKRKASQIIGSLAHLTERKDLVSHLPILVAGLRTAIVDPVPATRATASKALGSTVEKLGEDALPDLIPSLMNTLKADTGAGDRLGSAQALSEVLAGLGTTRLEETLPTILQNATSPKASVREGFMSLFIFLPACFGNSFSNYLNRIIPPILSGLADDIESIRETALRAGRLLVKNFATRAIDLLLPELERGLADDNYRIRLSSVELVGDLLFNLTGITAKAEQDEDENAAQEAGASLLEVLGEEKRNKVLSAIYICRCDTSGLVRAAAINVWKALVATPRTLREILPALTQLLIRRLASSNMEQKVIASNALGELIRKAGEGVLTTLLPTLEDGLQSTDTDAKQGICIALREIISSSAPEALEDYEKTLISVVRTALVDSDSDVREAAAEAFDSLQRIFGKRAVDQVLPHLLTLLRTDEEADNALAALLTLLTDNTRSNIILPNLLPTLLKSPMTSFNANAIASLAEVASSAMTRRLPNILNSLMDNIITCKTEQLRADLNAAFDSVLLSVDEFDGLNTMMSVMLALVKHDDHRRRQAADTHMATFCQKSEVDFSRYYPDIIRSMLIAFDDRDAGVVKAAWEALTALTGRLRKEEMESLVVSTRQVLLQVGTAGSDLPGFSLPKGINAILPIFLQGLMNGTPDQRTQAALAISDIIDRTNAEALRPAVTQITGPLIRVVSERSTDVKAAILFTLNNLLEKIPTFLKPFLPQLQRTFTKSLADTTSEVLRTRAAKALGTLITLIPRVDPLIAELVTGSKTPDAGVRNAMIKALYEVVSKAGANMSEASRGAILGLIDADTEDGDDSMAITNAKLLGAMIKVLPSENAAPLVKNRVLTTRFTHPSILALNAVLAVAVEKLTEEYDEETRSVICQGIGSNQPFISDNAILAAGKYLLSPSASTRFEDTKPIFEALGEVIQPGKPNDSRRLALVVIRTVGRQHNDLIRPHIPLLTVPIFSSVRDMIIPVKLAAEAAFLSLFDVVEEENAVFDKYMAGPGANLPTNQKRAMQDYFKRVAIRLASQAKERKEAEGGSGGLGLSSDELDDEKEVWSIGRVDLGEGAFTTD